MNIDSVILHRWMADVLASERTDPEVSAHVVASLIQTSLRGVDSHGARLFPHYVRSLRAGGINGRPAYQFNRTAPSCAILNADHTFGHAAGAEAMRRAMSMAAEAGMGSVAVRSSSHFGAAAYFALIAADADMIGMAFTHSDALLRTHAGRDPFLGPNPICFAAPCEGEEPFCLDMSCSSFSWNKVRQHRESGEPLPEGVAADVNGAETQNARDAVSLIPIGGYKGYGLALMVEIFCSLLTGAKFGGHLTPMFNTPLDTRRELGHFFLAVDIARFTPKDIFKSRLKSLLDELRGSERMQADEPIRVAGDPEKECARRRSTEGIILSDAEWRDFESLARECGIPIPPPALTRAAR